MLFPYAIPITDIPHIKTAQDVYLYCILLLFILVFYTTDPVPNVTAPNDQIVGQSLLLGCSVVTLSNVTEVDIVWRIRDGPELNRTESVGVSSTTGYSNTFESSYNITLLSTDDDDRMYQCVVVIDGTEIVGSVSLDVSGR